MKSLTLLLLLTISSLLIAQPPATEELVLKTTTGELHGILTMADTINQTPIVIIIPGSGPTDRNGNGGFSLYTNAYQQLAGQLAMNGISTLRFDKRGIGKSQPAAISESDLRFNRFIDDAVLWVEQLKKDQRFSGIYLMGHSQGSLIGMVAAQKTSIDGLISISGAGRSIDVELKDQLRRKLPDKLYDEAALVLDTLKAGQPAHRIGPYFYALFRPSIQAYMTSWMQYDPAVELARLTIPLLLVHGSTDIQVSVENVHLLHQAAPDAQLVIIEGMNHVLKAAPLDQPTNMATYTDGTLPVKEELVEHLVAFIQTASKAAAN